MKKVLFLGALALGVSACAPDIEQQPAPTAEDFSVAEFDPSASPAIVPSPNDLAIDSKTGLVAAPVNPAAPAAEQEFTRDYINTLNGFPPTAIANTLVKNLDPASVNTSTVKFIDLYAGTVLARPATPIIGYNPDTGRINVIPPQPQGWPKGGRYAVALIGGENGLKTTGGKPVIASATWAFASSLVPLVTCADLTAPDCRATTELIPSTKTDPAERLADQTKSALQLEQLRRGYAPILDLVASQFSVKREDIVLMWTFTIMDQPEATFDPANSIIPFPNDLLRAPATATAPAHLSLPVPQGTGPVVDLIKGLNTLDGWSTTAPIVSENGASTGAIDANSQLDPNTLSAVKLIKVSNTTKGTQPKVKVCLNCASSLKADGTTPTSPQQLQIVPEVPLDEATQYAAVITKGLKDVRGRLVAPTAAQALLRMSAPLVNENGKSNLSAVPDSIAAQLEPARAAMKPLFDGLEAAGIKRKDVSLAWVFTTQSTRAVMERLNAAPNAVPADPLYLTDQTSTLKAAMEANGFTNSNVGRAFIGAFSSPYLLDDAQGTLNRAQPRIDRVPFMLFLPSEPAPAGGYPVVVFGHGLTGNRTNVLAVANMFNANGFAVAAMDTVLHGERTSCAGITAQTPIAYGDQANPTIIDSPDEACAAGSTCDVTAGSPTYGRCVTTTGITCTPGPTDPAIPAAVHGDLVCASQGQGLCRAQADGSGKCEGGDFLRPSARSAPYVSGWNFLNLNNLFATRDNFRHHVVDFAQLARVLATDSINSRLNAAGAGTLNGAKVDYVGQSLGGLQGALSASVSPRMGRVALNAAGGGLVDVLLTATNPVFVARRAGFLAFLQAAGRVQGTPAFDEFIGLARAILDPADPRNYGWFLENASSAPNGREAFIQYIKGDDVIPNPMTEFLINAGNHQSQTTNRTVASYLFDVPVLPASVRHGFFTIFDPSNPGDTNLKAIRETAQAQVAGFLKTGTVTIP